MARQRRFGQPTRKQVLVIVPLVPDGGEDESALVDEQDVVEDRVVLQVVIADGGLELLNALDHLGWGRQLSLQLMIALLDLEVVLKMGVGGCLAGQSLQPLKIAF
ncbi:hypothetical protein CKO42_09970 [Lamprobacter modestohalophilus]|uniref:Uncharacterized protein n=1 Tax=Lamprobacter modestohalophilus TaxID=1064514 RepID=A0A9X0W9H1_9GAMM|nr:hypothetical protein [Lamprobacter modestohalophilus]